MPPRIFNKMERVNEKERKEEKRTEIAKLQKQQKKSKQNESNMIEKKRPPSWQMSTRGKYTQRRVAKKKKQNVEYNNQQIRLQTQMRENERVRSISFRSHWNLPKHQHIRSVGKKPRLLFHPKRRNVSQLAGSMVIKPCNTTNL